MYNVKSHPKFQNGEMTEEQIFKKFLNTFEVGSADIDGTVRRHKLSSLLSYTIREIQLSIFVGEENLMLNNNLNNRMFLSKHY